MKKLVCLILTLISVCVFAQDINDLKKIDSLETVLNKTKSDTARLSALIKLGAQYAWIQDKKSFDINEEAIALAKTLNRPYQQAQALSNIKDYYEFTNDTVNRKLYIEKILNLGEESGYKRTLGMGNYEKAVYFWERSPEKAEYYFKKSIEYYSKTGEKNRLNATYLQFGYYYQTTVHDYNKAMYYYRLIGSLYDKNDMDLVSAYSAMAAIYTSMKEYDKVLQYNLMIEDLYILNKKTSSRYYDVLLNTIGSNYKELKNNKKTLEYFNRFYENSLNKENYLYQAGGLINLADIYLNLNDLPNFNKMIKLSETVIPKINTCNQRASMFINIGDLFSGFQNYAEALNYYQKSSIQCEKTGLEERFVSLGNF